MKPDTDAIRRDIDKQRKHQGRWFGQDLLEAIDYIDAQAEENKRLEIEVANWKYWRGTATKANDKCEAENKRLQEELDRIRLDEIHNGSAIAALKPDTEEGET